LTNVQYGCRGFRKAKRRAQRDYRLDRPGDKPALVVEFSAIVRVSATQACSTSIVNTDLQGEQNA
jgi:hypothetical protein